MYRQKREIYIIMVYDSADDNNLKCYKYCVFWLEGERERDRDEEKKWKEQNEENAEI